jgi:hypothetical protein
VEKTGNPLSSGETGLWHQAKLSLAFSSPIKGIWNFAPFPVPIFIPYLLFDFFHICVLNGLLDASVVDGRGFESSYMHGYLSS